MTRSSGKRHRASAGARGADIAPTTRETPGRPHRFVPSRCRRPLHQCPRPAPLSRELRLRHGWRPAVSQGPAGARTGARAGLRRPRGASYAAGLYLLIAQVERQRGMPTPIDKEQREEDKGVWRRLHSKPWRYPWGRVSRPRKRLGSRAKPIRCRGSMRLAEVASGPVVPETIWSVA